MKSICMVIVLVAAVLVQAAPARAADFCWRGRVCSGLYVCPVDVSPATAPAPDGTPAPTGPQNLTCGSACDLWGGSGGSGCAQGTQWLYFSGSSRWRLCAKAVLQAPGCCTTPCDPQSDPNHCEVA